MPTDYLQNATFKKTLTDYVVALWNDANSKVANFIAPVVRVGTNAGLYKLYNNKEAFLIDNTEKRPGEKAAQVVFSATDGTYYCRHQALDCAIPNELLEGSDPQTALATFQSHYSMLIGRVATNHEYQIISKVAANVTVNASYGAGWLVAGNSTSSVSPIADLQNAYNTIWSNIGRPPNRVVFGTGAWTAFKTAFTTRGNFPQWITDEQAAINFLKGFGGSGLEFRVAPLAYANNRGQATRTVTNIVSTNDVYLFYASETPNQADASAVKCFEFGNPWQNIASYQSTDQRDTILKSDWFVDVAIASPISMIRFTAS